MNVPHLSSHSHVEMFMPNFMIAINQQSRIELFGMEREMSGATADELAQWMHLNIFADLDTSNLNEEYLAKATVDPK